MNRNRILIFVALAILPGDQPSRKTVFDLAR